MAQNKKIITSIMHHISGTVWHIVIIFGNYCKMMISPGMFFIFAKFWFFGLLQGVKEQKTVQNDKKFCPSHAPYLRNHTSYDFHLWYTCVKWLYLQVFFLFFIILIFWVVRGVKVQKNGPKWQKILSVMLHVSGTIHHIIVIYGTHVSNDNICRCFFFHFFKFWFFLLLVRYKRAKNGPKWQNILSVIHHMIFIYSTLV